jgi:hypothetical protein
MWYPLHSQVWEYPRLGISVLLEDRAISQHLRGAGDPFFEDEAAPDPAVLARQRAPGHRRAGVACSPPLPPGEHPLQVEAIGERVPGRSSATPARETWPRRRAGPRAARRCVVLDSTEHEVQRAARDLGASRCDAGRDASPATSRSTCRPGATAWPSRSWTGGGRPRRGREPRQLAPLPGGLTMSDIVLVCGPARDGSGAAAASGSDPNLARRIEGDEPLLAYFEVYALRPDASGAHAVRVRVHGAVDWTPTRGRGSSACSLARRPTASPCARRGRGRARLVAST